MKNFKSGSSYTALVHSVVKHKIQATLWDLITWLESGEEIHSVRDLLSYIRLFSDFGDANQGKIFLQLVRDYKTIGMILPEIADRFISRGKTTGTPWLEELGHLVKTAHAEKKKAGSEKNDYPFSENEDNSSLVFD